MGQLVAELDRIAQNHRIQRPSLLDGTFGTSQFQVGANANQTIVASTANLRTTVYGNNSELVFQCFRTGSRCSSDHGKSVP